MEEQASSAFAPRCGMGAVASILRGTMFWPFPRSRPRRLAGVSTGSASLVVLAIFATAVGCGGAYRSTQPAQQPGQSSAAPRGIEAAALPYTILDARTGRQLDTAAFWTRLGTAKVVCVGEEHPNPHHHWAQLEVVTKLTMQGRVPELALGMEMFQRPFQGVLDDFAAARIDEAALLSRSGWVERWGYDFAMYRPILTRIVKAGGPLIALNPAKELVKRISRQGLESLSAAERAALPELKLDDAAHRSWFDAVMAEMGGGEAHKSGKSVSAKNDSSSSEAEPAGHGDEAGDPGMPSADRIYTVQVFWDESMADGASRWVQSDRSHRVVIIAGNGHCHDTAVVGRIKRRGIADVVSVRPIVDADDNVATALARPMNDYLFVMTRPPDLRRP